MSSITYHFGGKEGLYLATADHIAAQMRHQIAPTIERAAALCGAEGSIADARAAIHAMLGGMVMVMLHDQTEAMARFIVREQADPTAAFDRIYDGVMGSMLDRLGGLVQRVSANRLDRHSARVRAISLVGQVLVFRVARATVMTGMGWSQITGEPVGMIAGAIHRRDRMNRRRIVGFVALVALLVAGIATRGFGLFAPRDAGGLTMHGNVDIRQ
eukprot:gene16414-20777_t